MVGSPGPSDFFFRLNIKEIFFIQVKNILENTPTVSIVEGKNRISESLTELTIISFLLRSCRHLKVKIYVGNRNKTNL